MEKIKPRWEFSMQTVKDIYGKTLRQLLPSIIDKEIMKYLKKNEEKLTLKFKTFLVLVKDIEHTVRNATNTWKNIYHLHKPSDFPVNVNDDDNDDEDKDEEGDGKESTHFLLLIMKSIKRKRLPRKKLKMMRKLTQSKLLQ